MEVNLTLFVQMGNFAIAYYVLRFLFFKPALAVLDMQERQLLAAQNKLQEHEQQLTEQRHTVEQAWRTCQDQFKRSMPARAVGDSLFFHNITPSFRPDPTRLGAYQEEQQAIEDAIVKEVSRVRA